MILHVCCPELRSGSFGGSNDGHGLSTGVDDSNARGTACSPGTELAMPKVSAAVRLHRDVVSTVSPVTTQHTMERSPMMVSHTLRRRVLELEEREDWSAMHTLLKTWPWPASELQLDRQAAFEEVMRRATWWESPA